MKSREIRLINNTNIWRNRGTMKIVVVYKSISGFTKKYVEWIAEELEADLLRLEKKDINIIFKYDIIRNK